jgi:hypothetical protein
MKTIVINTKEAIETIKKGYKDLSDQQNSSRFLARALNQTLAKTNTLTKKLINDKYNLKSGRVLKDLAVNKTNNQNLNGSLKASSKTIPLEEFKPKQISGKRIASNRKDTVQGISVEIMRGKSTQIRSAFIALASKTVAARGKYSNSFEFDGRVKPKTLKTLSILGAVRNEDNSEAIEDFATKEFILQTENEMRKQILNVGKRR